MSVILCHRWSTVTTWHISVTMSPMIYSHQCDMSLSPCHWRSTATIWHVSVTNILQVTVTSVTQDTNKSTLWQLDIHWNQENREISVNLEFDDILIPTTGKHYICHDQRQEKSCVNDFVTKTRHRWHRGRCHIGVYVTVVLMTHLWWCVVV